MISFVLSKKFIVSCEDLKTEIITMVNNKNVIFKFINLTDMIKIKSPPNLDKMFFVLNLENKNCAIRY